MTESFLAQLPAAGHYLAWWKLIIFFLCFVGWASLGAWLNHDARAVNTNRNFWNNLYMLCGVVGFLAWFLVPAPFIVELLLFLLLWLTISILYVLHRNARVAETERILTADHFRSLLAREAKKEARNRFSFISANGNELPIPPRDSEDYEGYGIAEEIIYDLYLHRSTESRFMPLGEEVAVHYTIDGMSSKMGQRDRQEMDAALDYLKAVADLDVNDKRKPQVGNFKIELDGHKIDFRIKTAGSTRGEQLLLEKIEDTELLELTDLGFLPDQLEQVQKLLNEPGGIILISGKPESGVTTTLYSLIRKHDAFTRNINSLEIEPEIDLDNITQNKVERGVTPEQAARQLTSVFRGDPDIVLVGFLNGVEMAKNATKFSREGKRIYVGVTNTSTFNTLDEWIKLIGNPRHVAESLKAVTYQVLIRKLCPECREAYTPDQQMLRRLNLPIGKIKQFFRPPTEMEYDKHGNPILCEHCQGSGYYGRTAVFETLFISESIAGLIGKGAEINEIRAAARKDRMLYLQEQAIRKVIDGTTSIQEVLRVTSEKSKAAKSAKE